MDDPHVVHVAFRLAGIIRPDECLSVTDQAFGEQVLSRCPQGVDQAAWLAAQIMPIYGFTFRPEQMPPIVGQFYTKSKSTVDLMEGIF